MTRVRRECEGRRERELADARDDDDDGLSSSSCAGVGHRLRHGAEPAGAALDLRREQAARAARREAVLHGRVDERRDERVGRGRKVGRRRDERLDGREGREGGKGRRRRDGEGRRRAGGLGLGDGGGCGRRVGAAGAVAVAAVSSSSCRVGGARVGPDEASGRRSQGGGGGCCALVEVSLPLRGRGRG